MQKKSKVPVGIRRFLIISLLVLAMLMICLFMAGSFQQSLLSAINEQHAQFTAQVNTVSEALQSMIRSYATQIYHSSAVSHVRTSAEHTNFEMIEAMREINKYETLCPFIDSIYLYNGKRGYIYFSSNSSAYSGDYIHRFKDESASALLMNLTPDKKLVPIYRSNGGYSPYSQNRYIYSYLMFDIEQGKALDNALMINIPVKWFNNFLFGDDNPSQWVIGADGSIIACPQWENPLTDAQQAALNQVRTLMLSSSPNGYFIEGRGSDRILYFYARMGNTGWQYVRSLPYEACMGPLLKVQRLVWTVFTLILILIISISVFLFVKVLFPYRRLITGISQIEGVDHSGGDVSKMLDQLTTLAGRSRDTERLNASFREMIREETVRNILFSSQNQPFDADLAQQYGMTLTPDRPLFLILVSSIRLGRYLEHARLFTPHVEGAVISAEYTVLLIQAEDGLQPTISQNISEAAPGRRVLYTPLCTNWNDIPAFFDMLIEAYRRCFLYEDMVLPCKDILQDLSDQSEPLESRIQSIIHALRKCAMQEVHMQYNELIACLKEKQLQTVYVTLSHLFADSAQMLLKLNPDAQPDFAARRKQFDTLIAAPQDMTQIHAYFDALFKEVIEAGNIRQKERRGSLISQITERIGEELNNPYLNSQSLADEFSFSSAYLCRIFKQETGVSLADYINVQRIEYAKKLLHNPDMLVKDIALETGFSSEKYFYVVFRKITGITPRQYRDQL